MISRKFNAASVSFTAALLLSLAACSTPMPRAVAPAALTQAEREARLVLRPDWSFSGRVAIGDGGSAGNAKILWVQRGKDFEIRLSAPITGQSWKLVRTGAEVRLEGLEGGPRLGTDAEALLLQASAWRVPVDELSFWVRGLQAGKGAAMEFSPQGLPVSLAESGWSVEYRAWNRDDLPLPTKMFARKGQASVRLVIDRWNAP